jgi:hypothetical protein
MLLLLSQKISVCRFLSDRLCLVIVPRWIRVAAETWRPVSVPLGLFAGVVSAGMQKSSEQTR